MYNNIRQEGISKQYNIFNQTTVGKYLEKIKNGEIEANKYLPHFLEPKNNTNYNENTDEFAEMFNKLNLKSKGKENPVFGNKDSFIKTLSFPTKKPNMIKSKTVIKSFFKPPKIKVLPSYLIFRGWTMDMKKSMSLNTR